MNALLTREGDKLAVVVVQMPETSEEKDELVKIVRELVKKTGSKRYFSVFTAWMTKKEPTTRRRARTGRRS